jgi:hypothetical protein
LVLYAIHSVKAASYTGFVRFCVGELFGDTPLSDHVIVLSLFLIETSGGWGTNPLFSR